MVPSDLVNSELRLNYGKSVCIKVVWTNSGQDLMFLKAGARKSLPVFKVIF